MFVYEVCYLNSQGLLALSFEIAGASKLLAILPSKARNGY